MNDARLDSSIAIGLHFRHQGEKQACRNSIPDGKSTLVSRYVIFEVARGFMRSLIALHNTSWEYSRWSDLQMAAHSGQNRFKPYKMHTWLGAFDDFSSELEAEDGAIPENQRLEFFRAKLRRWVKIGWRDLCRSHKTDNPVGCRNSLPVPKMDDEEKMLVHDLPIHECGKADACFVHRFLVSKENIVNCTIQFLSALPTSKQGNDTRRHIEGLEHILSAGAEADFDGSKCHQSGDAIICLECSHAGDLIVTKNKRDFAPLVESLGMVMSLSKTATSTMAPSVE
jgi:hypothetical protein